MVAESSRDPDLAPFAAGARLGGCFVLRPAGGPAWLGFLTAMEREEAAATGLRLLDPESLGVRALLDAGADDGELWTGVLRAALTATEVEPGELALGGRPPAGELRAATEALAREGWSFRSGHAALRRMRRAKPDWQLALARAAALGTCEAFARAAEILAGAHGEADGLAHEGLPLTAGLLRAEIAAVLARHGLEQPEGNIVAVGAAAGVPHTSGDDRRRLAAGEAIVIDLFPRGGLFADCTRTFCVGAPPPALARAHAAVRDALVQAHGELRAGASGWELQRGACERLAQAGYPTPLSAPGSERGYVHGLGHGVGFELHELPSFRRGAGDDGLLREGDVLTLEPGLYEPGEGWGVRLEDMAWLGPRGPENLTPLPYELDPRAWGGAERAARGPGGEM